MKIPVDQQLKLWRTCSPKKPNDKQFSCFRIWAKMWKAFNKVCRKPTLKKQLSPLYRWVENFKRGQADVADLSKKVPSLPRSELLSWRIQASLNEDTLVIVGEIRGRFTQCFKINNSRQYAGDESHEAYCSLGTVPWFLTIEELDLNYIQIKLYA